MNPSSGKQKGSTALLVLSIVVGLFLILAGIYIGISKRYETMFLPGTTINNLNVSGMTVSQAQKAMEDSQGDYTLTLVERDGITETITGESIHLSLSFDDSLSKLLGKQNSWSWPICLWGGRTRTESLETMYSYDTGLLTEQISGLRCMNSAASTPPKDAYLSNYDPDAGGVTIVPEVPGNLVDQEILLPAIQNAVASMQTELNLDELDCYVKPKVTSEDETLKKEADQLNQYLGINITYEFGEDKVSLTGQQLIDWLSFDDDGTVTVSEDKATAFVRNLAYTYNTCFSTRTFTTTYGQDIEITGGDYGWWMDEPAETEALIELIKNKESGTRTPIWKQEAKSFGDPDRDFGNTYIEVNLTAQHLYFYKDGQLFLESDFVSGKNDRTPTGTYGLLYCERYATLNGENYSSPVSYWMPFYNGVGLHDAPWRTSFGGTIYKSNGSHGCINLPVETAKTIYENVNAHTGVIVYKLDGTERSDTSSQSYEQIASAIVDALDEIEGEGAITSGNYTRMSKRIKWVQEAYAHLSGSAKDQVTNYDKLAPAVSALNSYKSKNGL